MEVHVKEHASYEKPNKPEHYLTADQVRQKKEDIAKCDAKLASPVIEEKKQVREQRRLAEKSLEYQAPPELSPLERDKVARRVQELEGRLRQGLPTAEEMRKKPPGAVTKHQAWERNHKQELFEYRRGLRMLNPDSNDSELGSVERLRPQSNSLNMDNAYIPGKNFNFPSEQFKENYDRIDWDGNSSNEQVSELAAEMAEMKKELEELRSVGSTKKKEKGWTPEKRAEAAEKARANLLARRQLEAEEAAASVQSDTAQAE